MNSIKDFLQTTIEGIVENSDAVSVSEETAQDTTQLLINVDDADMGRVIGKDGKVINSLRTISRVMAIRQNIRVRVDLVDRREQAPEATPVEPEATAKVIEDAPTPEAVAETAPEAEATPEVAPAVEPEAAPEPEVTPEVAPVDFVGTPTEETPAA